MKQLNWYQIFGKSNIPDGRTVLPTDDIQIWLNCANIWDKTYTTLAEVLADTTTLLALINSPNAVDYMVRSTTWAAAVTVPAMTSDTTPSGVVSVSTFYDSNSRGYKAFDGNDSTRWESANVTPFVNVWIQYQFANPITVAKIKMLLPQRNQPSTFQLQGSNDGENFTTVQSYTNDSASQTTKEYTNSDTAEYSYWRLLVTSIHKSSESSSWWTGFNTLQFYSASICDNSTAMSYIGLNNYCANTLLADSTWCEAICNSEYFESVLNVKVPIMTGYNTPSGLVFVRNNYATDYGWCAFDGNSETRWISASGSIADNYIGYEFTEKINICLIEMKGGNTSSVVNRTIHDYKLQSSDDRNTWQDVGNSRTFSQVTSVQKAVIVEQTNNYDFRILVLTNYGGSYVHVTSLQFYGRKDV